LQVYFIAICGFQKAQNKVERKLEELKIPVKIHICDPLDDTAKIFSDKSPIFPDPTEREKAKQIVEGYGLQLVKNTPLGYGDCQAVIVFEHNCPNNSLPILWKESSKWKPLFKRSY